MSSQIFVRIAERDQAELEMYSLRNRDPRHQPREVTLPISPSLGSKINMKRRLNNLKDHN